jgi:hypothetical protein
LTGVNKKNRNFNSVCNTPQRMMGLEGIADHETEIRDPQGR